MKPALEIQRRGIAANSENTEVGEVHIFQFIAKDCYPEIKDGNLSNLSFINIDR